MSVGKNNTIKKNTEVIFDASKEVTLEVNAEKTKYTCIPCYSGLRLVLFCYSALAFFLPPWKYTIMLRILVSEHLLLCIPHLVMFHVMLCFSGTN
jgi:hypothetical protein